MSLVIAELIEEVTKRIEASEGRSRSRTTDEQLRFKHAVHVLLTDLWKAVKSTPIRECSCLGPLKLCHYLLTKGVTENGTETVFG